MTKAPLLAAVAILLAGPVLAAPNDPPAPAAPARPAASDRGVMRYDANKDGTVTLEEWKAGQQARFKRLDVDSDGKLTQAELFARTPSVGNSVLPTDREAGRQSAYFQRLDTDKDGVVTVVEFMTQGDRNFARCDIDKNGRIDTAECRQALQRPPAGR